MIVTVIPRGALAMKVKVPLPRGRPVLPWEEQLDLVWLIGLIAAALMVWYFGQRILAVLLVRKATAFCTRCFSPRIRQALPRGSELLAPYLPSYDCENCGKHFFRGRKPPFARCPQCRSAELETITCNQVHKSLLNAIRSFFGCYGYSCPFCEFRFVDFRPLRFSWDSGKPRQARLDSIQRLKPASDPGSRSEDEAVPRLTEEAHRHDKKGRYV